MLGRKMGPSKRLAVEIALSAYEESFRSMVDRLFGVSTLGVYNKRGQLLIRVCMQFKKGQGKSNCGEVFQGGTANYFVLTSGSLPVCYYMGTVGPHSTLCLSPKKLVRGNMFTVDHFSFGCPEVCE